VRQGVPALEHIGAVAIEAHVAPVGGVLRLVDRVAIAHVGDSRAREVEGTAIGGEQGFNHVGVLHLLAAEAIDGDEQLRVGRAAAEFSGHGVDHRRIDEGLTPCTLMIRALADSLLQPRTRSWSATEAMRSRPDSQAELLRIASKPHEAAVAARSGLSVQSSTAAGAVARPQHSSTCWSIG